MQRDYQREPQHLSFTETLLQDLRFMLRMLRKSPQFTVITLLVLALGIGANAAIFSLIEGVLLRPLDYRDPERLFTIREVVPKLSHLYPTLPANAKHVAEWQNRCSSFEDIAQMNTGTVSLSGAGEPQQIVESSVSWNFFQVLGTQARLGRTFLPEEDQPGRNDVVVLSDSLWQRQFNADPSMLNNKVLLDGKPYTVIGILPAEFRYPEVESTNRSGKTPEVFMTLGIDLNTIPDLGEFDNEVIARTQKNVSAEQALAELNSVQSQISAQIPGNVELLGKMQPLQDAIVGSSRQDLLVLFAAVGAILLIVCVNLANLLLARMKRRKREFAVRAALGASPGRLIRQCLTEGLTIALMGGALGIALASLGVKILISSAPVDLPRLNDVRLNWAVILFAILISGFAGIVISILPAWKIARGQQNEDLKTGPNRTTQGPRSARMRQILVCGGGQPKPYACSSGGPSPDQLRAHPSSRQRVPDSKHSDHEPDPALDQIYGRHKYRSVLHSDGEQSRSRAGCSLRRNCQPAASLGRIVDRCRNSRGRPETHHRTPASKLSLHKP